MIIIVIRGASQPVGRSRSKEKGHMTNGTQLQREMGLGRGRGKKGRNELADAAQPETRENNSCGSTRVEWSGVELQSEEKRQNRARRRRRQCQRGSLNTGRIDQATRANKRLLDRLESLFRSLSLYSLLLFLCPSPCLFRIR